MCWDIVAFLHRVIFLPFCVWMVVMDISIYPTHNVYLIIIDYPNVPHTKGILSVAICSCFIVRAIAENQGKSGAAWLCV